MVAYMIIKAFVIFLSFVAFSGARKFPDFTDALAQLRFLEKHLSSVERVWSESYDQQWMSSVVSNITTTLNQSQCLLDLYTWAVALKNKESWAIQSQCN